MKRRDSVPTAPARASDPVLLAEWLEEDERVNRSGDVSVSLRCGARSLVVQVSAAGTHAQRLCRTRFGDVSYNEVSGLAESEAAEVARAYAARLEEGATPLSARFPHLALAHDGGRAPGSHRTLIASLWPRGLELSTTRDELRFDADGVRDFLAPEVRAEGPPFAGFALRAIRAGEDGAGCEIEMVPATASRAEAAIVLALSARWEEGDSFAATRQLCLALRQGGTDRRGDLIPDVARFCSLLAALLETKQSPSFVLRLPEPGASAGAESRVGAARPRSRLSPKSVVDSEVHRFSILSSGYTVLRQALPVAEVEAIAAGVDRALAAMQAAVAAGRDLAYTFYDKDTYLGTRCLYCWGDACARLVENENVQEIAAAVIGAHKLFDMSAHRALPAARFGAQRSEEWHRDIDVFPDSSAAVRYLWFFVPLVDFTPENGATWIVPGSQRLANEAVPPKGASGERFPTRVQLLGRVGDVFVINPSALHSVGHNATEESRTMINLGVCHAAVRPLLDHWSIAGPALQAGASERLRAMLGAAAEPALDTTWSVLPEGWETSRRDVVSDPAARVFPPEQQGYQRSHRLRDEE